MSSAQPAQASPAPTPEVYYIPTTNRMPSSPLPLLVYRNVLPTPVNEDSVSVYLQRFGWEKRGAWGAITIKHFHPNTHECYGVFQGGSELVFGATDHDETMDLGVKVKVYTGDVIVVPAGVSHASVTNDSLSEDAYKYVGVYPLECPKWRNEFGKQQLETNDKLHEEIAAVPIPRQDPLSGVGGPLVQIWNSARSHGRSRL